MTKKFPHDPDSITRQFVFRTYIRKVANRGEWIRHKWHVRRGYLKIHVAVNIKNKKIISLEVTSEEVPRWQDAKEVD